MKAGRLTQLWAHVKESALAKKLRSPQGPVLIALSVALLAIMIYMACNLNSCTGSKSIANGGSLWGSSSKATDEDLGKILSKIDGAGQTDVLITYDKSGALLGVVVVSEGAEDKQVAVKLMRAVQTATGADLDQIQIFQKSK